jgi:serine phosphatase RsbU (regulator of sigma subunit)
VATLKKACVEWGVASRILPGQIECGDVSVVLSTKEGALAAVADGLGHGDEAAIAARMVLGVLEESPEEHIISLVKRCHEVLRGTRGAVMSIASFSIKDSLMTWLGVGNVEGILIRADSRLSVEGLLLRGGVLGGVLPPLQAAVLPVAAGDILVLATDGIRAGFEKSIISSATPQQNADRILQNHGRATDDALVLAVRFMAGLP